MLSRSTLSFLFLTLLATGCSKVESHDLRLTHPPKVFGEYTTQTTFTADFEGAEIVSSILGRRPEYDSRPIKDNVVLINSRETVTITVSNPGELSAIAPQTVVIIFYDGPTGAALETLSITTEVVPPGQSRTASVTTAYVPSSGSFYWSYHVAHAENWETALAEYEASSPEQVGEDDDDDWGDEDW